MRTTRRDWSTCTLLRPGHNVFHIPNNWYITYLFLSFQIFRSCCVNNNPKKLTKPPTLKIILETNLKTGVKFCSGIEVAGYHFNSQICRSYPSCQGACQEKPSLHHSVASVSGFRVLFVIRGVSWVLRWHQKAGRKMLWSNTPLWSNRKCNGLGILQYCHYRQLQVSFNSFKLEGPLLTYSHFTDVNVEVRRGKWHVQSQNRVNN